MNCAHCTTPIPDDSRFCLHCGSLVSDAEGQKAASAKIDASSTARMERVLQADIDTDYIIERQLGRGGMAMVYLATEKRIGRKVAIKVLPPELTFGHGVDRFIREAKTAATLDHPNIIPIYRIASGDTIFWYVMKYLEGRSLDDILKEKHRFDLKETIAILSQVADALDYAHEHKVIHRDIKPANVMLDSRNRVIVTDFGIAKALTEGTLTASGSVIGTPYYMSPEQGMGNPVSGASDQYSLAVMAYQMLSGQLPFEGGSAIDILHKHVMVPPPPLDVLRPNLPAHVYAAINRGLAKKAEQRFPTVTALVNALQQPSADATMPSAKRTSVWRRTSTKVVDVRKPRGLSVPMIIGGAIVLGAGLGGGWLWLNRDSSDSSDSGSQTVDTEPGLEKTRFAAGDSTQGAPDTGRRYAADPTAQPVAPTPRVPTTGQVTITGLPRGGRVLIDGRYRSGTTFELATGRHAFRLEAPGFEPMVDSVTVDAGGRATLAFSGKAVAEPAGVVPGQPPVDTNPLALAGRGVLLLRITPWARVSIDGTPRGEVTRLADTLRVGSHLLKFERTGFLTVDTTVIIRAGRDTSVVIQMRQGTQ